MLLAHSSASRKHGSLLMVTSFYACYLAPMNTAFATVTTLMSSSSSSVHGGPRSEWLERNFTRESTEGARWYG
jgi:hypothetical protein